MRYALVLALAACASPPITVLQQAQPNPFTQSGCKLSIEALAFDRLVIDGQPEAQWLANKSPEEQAKWQDDKTALTRAVKLTMTERNANVVVDGPPTGGNAFLLRPSLVQARGGEYELEAIIADPSGRALDQVRVHVSRASLHDAAPILVKDLNDYIQSRLRCAR